MKNCYILPHMSFFFQKVFDLLNLQKKKGANAFDLKHIFKFLAYKNLHTHSKGFYIAPLLSTEIDNATIRREATFFS
jgi:hypothetical protein